MVVGAGAKSLERLLSFTKTRMMYVQWKHKDYAVRAVLTNLPPS